MNALPQDRGLPLGRSHECHLVYKFHHIYPFRKTIPRNNDDNEVYVDGNPCRLLYRNHHGKES